EPQTVVPDPPDSQDDTDQQDTDDTGPPEDTGEEPPPPFDCDNQPAGPYTGARITAWTSEDLAFDDQGNLVGNDFIHIYKTDYQGNRQVFVPNLSFRAGMRMLTTGELIIANDNQGSVMKVQSDGAHETLLSGLSYPNGIEVGLDDFVYVTEHDAMRVRRIDPATGDHTTISKGEIQNPNGITFNEDYTALYIGGFSGVGTIYKLPIDKQGNPGALEEWATGVGTGWLDGMGVDYCGNLYIADYGASKILRYTPDGKFESVVVNGAAMGGFIYMPNFQWGSGIGGWDPLKLYVAEGGLPRRAFEVDLGIPAKPR
ncbi:MAG: hypothetical protein HN348_36105, partial [Proteobacteria bacterium]|nr:hypothetical protein [Pseudomonadota bacterium]